MTWEGRFTPELVERRVLVEGRVLVVGAGEPSPEVKAAASALHAAVLATKRARIVLAPDAVAVTGADDDRTILERTKGLPLDVVWIVRVFPGERTTAVVTLYEGPEALVDAFSVEAASGKEPAAPAPKVVADAVPPPSLSAPEGLPRAAASAMSDIADTRSQYMRRRVWFRGYYRGFANLLFFDPTPYKGEQTQALGAREFYEYVGRPDLVQRYDVRKTWKTVAIVTGTGLIAAGVFALATRPDCADYDTGYTSTRCSPDETSSRRNYLVFGISGISIGTLAAAITGGTSTNPLSFSEMTQVADAFNEKIAAELNIVLVDPVEDADEQPTSAR